MRLLITICVVGLFLGVGCGEPKLAPGRKVRPLTPDSPASVRIVGLTRIKQVADDPDVLEVYMEVRDQTGQQIKTPADFLFELYEYVPRSPEPAGRRLQMWETRKFEPERKSTEWVDYLKAYYFELPLKVSPANTTGFLLQVTCFTPEQRRLTDTFRLSSPQDTSAQGG